MGLSFRAYAADRKARGLSGGTDTAVRKAVKMGRIKALPDGSIDPKAADADWAGATDERKLRGNAPAARPKMRLDDGDDGPSIIVADPTAGMTAKAAATFNDIRTKRELLKLKKDIRVDKTEEKSLVDRGGAKKAFTEFGMLVRTKFDGMPDIAGPQLAAKYGVGEHMVVEDLKGWVKRFLTEIAEEVGDPFKPKEEPADGA